MRFEEVGFRYHEEGPWVLRNFDLTVPRGARIGFVGPTGCGKSTTLDLLMGLLKPTEGRILVDGEPLEGPRLRAWQRNIAHVPQAIFLADTTLAENIAFGVPKEQIDLDRVRQAARKAQIADFIESRPEGYGARVGERGIQLSGGQRQRIGIARALYKQATVLVFDEATSALDHATEGSVMDAINNLGRDLTIVLIAHRLSTVERCDSIVQMGPGESVELNNRWALVQRAVYGGAPPISGSEQQ
jgi:ATP-binding cassette subfamily B protein